MSPSGSLCSRVGNDVEDSEVFPLDIDFYPIFKSLGLKLRNRLIWHFEHGLHCSPRFSGCYETLLWFTKGDDYAFNLDTGRVPTKYPGKTHFTRPKHGLPSGNPLGKNPGKRVEVYVGTACFRRRVETRYRGIEPRVRGKRRRSLCKGRDVTKPSTKETALWQTR